MQTGLFLQVGGDYMTQISIRERNEFFDICMIGHAETGEYGKDIVCAALSAFAYVLREVFRVLQEEGKLPGPEMELRPGLVRMKVPIPKEAEHTVRTVIHAVIRNIQALQGQYPQAVKLSN